MHTSSAVLCIASYLVTSGILVLQRTLPESLPSTRLCPAPPDAQACVSTWLRDESNANLGLAVNVCSEEAVGLKAAPSPVDVKYKRVSGWSMWVWAVGRVEEEKWRQLGEQLCLRPFLRVWTCHADSHTLELAHPAPTSPHPRYLYELCLPVALFVGLKPAYCAHRPLILQPSCAPTPSCFSHILHVGISGVLVKGRLCWGSLQAQIGSGQTFSVKCQLVNT